MDEKDEYEFDLNKIRQDAKMEDNVNKIMGEYEEVGG